MALARLQFLAAKLLVVVFLSTLAFAEQEIELDFDLPGEALDTLFDANVTVHDIPATGAEDLDVWRLRSSNRHAFHNLLYAMNAPHVAMVGLRAVAGDGFDKMLFGASDTAKSPFSWSKAFFSPGLLSIEYSLYFFDTNPVFTVLVCLMYISSDLSFWLSLCTIALLPSRAVSTVSRFLSVMLTWVLLVLLHHYVVFPVTPDPIMDLIFYSYLLLGPILSYSRVRALYDALRMARREAEIARRVVDPVKEAAVLAVVTSSEPLFDSTHWRELYTRSASRLSRGSFGEAHVGRRITDGHQVVIKTMTKRKNERQQILGKLAMGTMHCALGVDTLSLADAGREAIATLVAEVLRKGDLFTATSAENETRALKAAAALQHPFLQRFCSAHRFVESSGGGVQLAIVTSYATGVYRKLAYKLSQREKMVLIRNLFDAIAALHAGGIVHRDLHPDNFAVDAASPTTPIILDFGLASLPGRDDPYMITMGQCRIDQFPPEFRRFQKLTQQSADMGAVASFGNGALGPPSDVFAIALHALHLLTGKNPIEYVMVDALFKAQKASLSIPEKAALVATKMAGLKADSDAHKRALADTIAGLTAVDLDTALTVILRLPSQAPLHDLFTRMLHPDPALRLTMADALRHPGLEQVLPEVAPQPRTEVERATLGVADGVPPQEENAARMRTGRGQVDATSRLTRLAQLREVISGTAAILQRQGQAVKPVRLLSSEDVGAKLTAAMDAIATGQAPTGSRRRTPEQSSPRSPYLHDVQLTREQLSGLIHLFDLAPYVPDGSTLFDLLDEDDSGTVDGRELLAGLAYILAPLASDATRLRLTFLAYDINRDGLLSKQELQLMLQAYGHVPHGQGDMEVEGMVERVYKVLSQDSAKPISCDRFLEVVNTDSMLRQLLLG